MRMTMFALSARIKPAGVATSPSVHVSFLILVVWLQRAKVLRSAGALILVITPTEGGLRPQLWDTHQRGHAQYVKRSTESKTRIPLRQRLLICGTWIMHPYSI